MVYLYGLSVTDLPDPLDVPYVMAGLSAERKEKIQRYRQPQDRKLSLGAGLLLQKSFQLHGFSDAAINYGQNGKPEAAGICFNLSHSCDLVLCAVSHRNVGCDIEKIKEIDQAIASYCFAEKEAAYLNSCNESERLRGFFRLWTWKESYLKMTGEGMGFALNRVMFERNGSVQVLRDGKKEACFLKEYDLPGYQITVCAEESEFSQLQFFSFRNGQIV